MTDEERQQIQNIINARTKLLTEKLSRQDEEIKELGGQIIALTTALENREQTIEDLKTKLSESNEKELKLTALLEELQSKSDKIEPETKVISHEKPNYLISLLRQHFGFDSFKNGQEDIINSILSGRDVFCSMPFNYGKSIIYRLSALLMPGLTLVISQNPPEKFSGDPHSEYLTENLQPVKKREIIRKIKNGACKILYSDLAQLIEQDIFNTLKGIEISMAAVISEWGNFDPEKFKALGNFLSSVSSRKITTGIFADSTSPAMRKALTDFAELRSPLIVVTGFNRPNISFKIFNTENKTSSLNEILVNKDNMSGIILCSNPDDVYKLRERFSNRENITVINENSYREIKDSNFDFMVNYDIPETLGIYSEEISRIGKYDSKIECFVLSSRKFLRTVERAVIEFCRSENPKSVFLEYLGEDENSVPKNSEIPNETTEQNEEILYEDFDFGTSNEAQKEAITTINGALLISAGAGTGKTYTLIQRIIFLIQKKKAKPENIFMAVSSEREAGEISAKLKSELIKRKINPDIDGIYLGTFESICERILREFSKSEGFNVIDDFGNSEMILTNIKRFNDLKSFLKTSGELKNSCELREIIDGLYKELIDPEELIKDNDPSIKAIGSAMKIYSEILSENKVLSYSALMSTLYKMLRENPEILDSVQDKIRYLMIDDYQNANYIQEQIALLLSGGNKNICVSGDEGKNILEFPDKFGKNECKIVKLILNYRSESGIIKFFKEWIDNDKKIEAFRTEQNNFPSVMRLAGVNDKDEWHEKILSFINLLRDSGKIKNYNEIAFLFRSLKTGMSQDLAKFLENNNINIYSPNSNIFLYRNEIYFAMGVFLSVFPHYMKALKDGEFSYNGTDPEHIIYYKNCLKYFSRFINRPNYEDLKKWIVNKRKEKINEKFSNVFYELTAFKPFNTALDVNINEGAKSLKPAKNLAKLIHIVKNFERSNELDIMKFLNVYMPFIISEGLNEFENIPSEHVLFMTFEQSKGMEFPLVFVDSLYSTPDSRNNENILTSIIKNYSRRSEIESEENIKYIEFKRNFYSAFSRAENILILTCNEDSETPCKYFETLYNGLEDADEIEIPADFEFNSDVKEIKRTYSFNEDILLYEKCPTKYKLYREFNFESDFSRNESESELKFDFENYSTEGAVILKKDSEIEFENENYIIKDRIGMLTIKDGETEITSFKHGSKPNININSDKKRLEIYKRQLNLQAYIVERSLGLKVKRIKIRYIGENSEMIFDYDEREGTKIINDIDGIIKRIMSGDFERRTSDSEICGNCDFRFYCRRE